MRFTTLLAFGFLLGSISAAGEPLRVVTTIPDLADITSVIGGDRVEVRSLAKGTENIHSVPLKPSALVAMNKADVLVQIGLSLEHAYVPGLLENARNKSILPGAPGSIVASEGWEPIQVPDTVSRGLAADVHPMGNPHLNLSARGGRFMADRILEGLLRVDPPGEAGYRERHAAYVAVLEEKQAEWAELVEVVKGKTAVAYHANFSYLAEELGLEVIELLEPKPGVTPTPRHIAHVAERMRETGTQVILTARWSNNKSVRFLAEKTGATVLELPEMVQLEHEPDTWVEMMDMLHQRLHEAFADR